MTHSLDGVSVAVMVLLAAFAIERLTSGILFLLCWAKVVRNPGEQAPGAGEAANKYRMAYFVVASVLSLVLLIAYPKVRILLALGGTDGTLLDRFFDTLLTAIVYVGGADRISALFKDSPAGAGARPAQPPITVTGKLELTDSAIHTDDRGRGTGAP